MIRSKWMQSLMRALITLLGAGVGVAIALGTILGIHQAKPNYEIELGVLVTGYVGMATISAFIFFLLSRRILNGFSKLMTDGEHMIDRLTLPQILSRVAGLILGMIIAALFTQVLHFMGDSLFTTILSLIMYLVLGTGGYNVGRKRSEEFETLALGHNLRTKHYTSKKKARKLKHAASNGVVKVLDTSVLIDGRIVDVCRLGFLEGPLLVPDFVLAELRHIADSADASRRAKGRRGMETLQKLQELPVHVTTDTPQISGNDEVDVQLLKLARKMNAAVVTGDYNLAKIARVSSVQVMNLNELSSALRPTVATGDEL